MERNVLQQPQQITTDVLLEKYAKNGENTAEEIYLRVAKGVASAEATDDLRARWATVFYDNMVEGAVGAGRIMSAAGSDVKATLINCFVVDVGDAIDGIDENGVPGIYEALRRSACTMQKGGGVGYNFSNIRPKGAVVKSVGSFASGPCSYIDIFDASCKTIESAGSRRGAQLGALDITHPDIYDFISAKRTVGRWNNFNVSVLVTDAFMQAKNNGEEVELVHKATPSPTQIANGAYQRSDGLWVYKKVNANELWTTIMRSNYDYAEPGILFYDNINNDNNLRYVETITTTNPCGEQPLPANGCCDLGPVILPKFVRHPFTPQAYFDFEAFAKAVRIQVRFLDNVLDATLWPLKEQHEESKSKRRIGVGFTGLGNALAMCNEVYYSESGLRLAERISETMRDEAYAASVDLAIEKGPFPLFNAKKYLESGTFASRLPTTLKQRIRKHGIRNSHLLSVAPVGTVSLAFADNASNGIEPPFSLAYTRKKREPDGSHSYYNVLDHGFRVYLSTLEDQNYAKALENAVSSYQSQFTYDGVEYDTKRCLPEVLVTALEMSVDDHLAMMKVVRPYVDSAISKTCNVPVDYPFEDFKQLYDKAWEYGLKGISTYRPNQILGSVLSTEAPKETTVTVTPDAPKESLEQIVERLYTEVYDSRTDGVLQGISSKGRFYSHEGEQKFIVTINFVTRTEETEYGRVSIRRPVEFLLTSNFTTTYSSWQAAMRFMSLMGRSGVSIPKIIENLREIKWEHGRVQYGTIVKDGKSVNLWHASDAAALGYVIQEALINQGYLNHDGQLTKTYTLDGIDPTVMASPATPTPTVVATVTPSSPLPATGKPCPECGSNSLAKRDGCEKCDACGYIGSCG